MTAENRPVDPDRVHRFAHPYPLSRRVAGVVALIVDHGSIEGTHHLRWLVDQILREAAGSPAAYRAIVAAWEAEYPGWTWDEGIAP